MNYTDFSQTGGFPLDADVLDFNHKALAEAFKAPFANPDGTYPAAVIISGCTDVTTSDFVEDGWIFFNGEILPFKGSYTNQWGTGGPFVDGDLFLVETRQQAVFQSGQTYDVLEVTRWLTCDPQPAPAVPVGNIYQIPRLEEILGTRAAGQDDWRPFSGTFGPITWNLKLRRNPLTRLVYLRGEATINAATVGQPAIRYMLLELPDGYNPSANLAFAAHHDYHSITNPEDAAIRTVTCKIFQSGGKWNFSIAPVKPSDPSITSYKVLFHTVYSMD